MVIANSNKTTRLTGEENRARLTESMRINRKAYYGLLSKGSTPALEFRIAKVLNNLQKSYEHFEDIYARSLQYELKLREKRQVNKSRDRNDIAPNALNLQKLSKAFSTK